MNRALASLDLVVPGVRLRARARQDGQRYAAARPTVADLVVRLHPESGPRVHLDKTRTPAPEPTRIEWVEVTIEREDEPKQLEGE